MDYLCFLDLGIRKFPEAQSFIDAGIGFVIEKAEDLSEQLNALDNKLELKKN